MSDALEEYKAGNWNEADIEVLPDDSVIITMRTHGKKTTTSCRVKNLNKPNEEVLDYATGEPIAE